MIIVEHYATLETFCHTNCRKIIRTKAIGCDYINAHYSGYFYRIIVHQVVNRKMLDALLCRKILVSTLMLHGVTGNVN